MTSVYYEKLVHMLKPLAPKFRYDLSVRLRDIAEKQVPTKLKPIVGGFRCLKCLPTFVENQFDWRVSAHCLCKPTDKKKIAIEAYLQDRKQYHF